MKVRRTRARPEDTNAALAKAKGPVSRFIARNYSGAVPNEKITWGKLAADTPRFIIESDATIVAPLVFAWVLGH